MVEAFYRVADEHSELVRVLRDELHCRLAAVRVREGGDKLFLGVCCDALGDADRIVSAVVDRHPAIADLDLGDWMARRAAGTVTVFWTGVEITRVTAH